MNEVVVLWGADADLIEHFNRFEDRSEGRGKRFDRAFAKACDFLARQPESAKRCGGDFRRYLMLEWHLGIFYSLTGHRVMIHAILDVRQDPQNIQRRLGLQ